MTKFLEVKNLSVSFPTEDGLVKASNDVSYSVDLGKTLAIVGESGSGKSVSNLAIMGLHNRATTQISGSAFLNLDESPIDVISAPEETVRRLRGKVMSMIFQDPMSALHPYFSVGNQIAEAWSLYNEGSKRDGMKRATEMLDLVGIPSAADRVKDFPHQFSGGMRQRVMIAMALVNNPKLLIADEPTTALDVTVQSQILKLIQEIQKEFNMAVILITHDLGVVAEVADNVCVMYGGKIVETSAIDEIFYRSQHPYTTALLESLPKGCSFAPRCQFVSHVSGNRCTTEDPELTEKAKDHFARCFLSTEQIQSLTGRNVKA